jgi:hypothetical protein
MSIDEINQTASGNSVRSIKSALVFLGIVLLLLLVAESWKRPVSGSGGLPIPGELVIDVPQFFQSDPRWREDLLGGTSGTLGAEGCAVTSASMALGFYGMSINPQKLNQFLTDHAGYEGKAWLRWESAAEYTPGLVQKAYEDLPSYGLIDWNLLHGNPVIVRIRRIDGITHFVVIVGKRGFDYLIADPAGWSHPDGGRIYPFAQLGVPIEALRYYRRLE